MNLHPSPPFLHTPGKPNIKWGEWIQLFDTYLLTSGGSHYEGRRKTAVLLNCLGVEGQRLYRALPESTDTYATTPEVPGPENGDASSATTAAETMFYDGALFKLAKFFTLAINKTTKRFKFRLRLQRPGEYVIEFVAVLRGLAVTCSFGSLTNDTICDQLTEKTCMPQIRDRLLLEPDIKLEDAIVIASQVEQAIKEPTLLHEETIARVSRVKDDTAKKRAICHNRPRYKLL